VDRTASAKAAPFTAAEILFNTTSCPCSISYMAFFHDKLGSQRLYRGQDGTACQGAFPGTQSLDCLYVYMGWYVLSDGAQGLFQTPFGRFHQQKRGFDQRVVSEQAV
jgi:hypothetical protein